MRLKRRENPRFFRKSVAVQSMILRLALGAMQATDIPMRGSR